MLPKHKKKLFDCFDVFVILISITAYLLDTVTDIFVSVLYLQSGHIFWGLLTLFFVVVPSVAIQIFSARWYIADGKGRSGWCCMSHLFQLQPLERYTLVLVAGLEARRCKDEEHTERFFVQQNDVSMLRLFEAFLESAPQLTLQLYIITCTNSANILTLTSACVSLISLGWSVAAYSHALRQVYDSRYSRHTSALVGQTLYHILIAASRVCSIVAFAAVFKYWIFLVLGLHWLVMTIWIVLQQTDFCNNKVEEVFFDCVVGIVYCFNFFNLKEGNTRWRALAFYLLIAAENIAFLAMWYLYKEERSWFDPLICASIALVFIMGISLMGLYYCFCHPSKPFRCIKDNNVSRVNSQTSTPNFNKQISARSINSQKNGGLPQYTSTVLLPRRNLLKPQNSKCNVQYKEVFTPSQFSPIKMPGLGYRNKQSYQDCSFEWDDNSAFQHYSVDATAGLASFSRVSALQASGINLSCDNIVNQMQNAPESPQYRRPHVVELQTFRSPRYSPTVAPVLKKGVSFDKNFEGDSVLDLSDVNEVCNIEGCRHCGKALPYMDQSMDNLGDVTVGFCNCTLMGNLGTNDASTDTNITDSSGFQSRESNHGNVGLVQEMQENSPLGLSQAINKALPRELRFL